ncbi:MAG: hypothetical protein ACRD5L_17810 [Bryobacteraceae bacterium]
MAIRLCPQCQKGVPAGATAAYSDKLECPHCRASLRVADSSKVIGAVLALAVGYLVWRLTQSTGRELEWLLPQLYGFFAYSVTYTLYVMATADLVMRPAEAAPMLTATGQGAGHGAAHH